MKKFIAIILTALIFASVPFASFAESGAFLVMDGRFGLVLEQENGDRRLPMASTTKIMTALVVLENTTLSETFMIPQEAVGIEGSSLYIKAGEEYSVEELLYGLMLRSANDCAVALAWYVGDESVEKFVGMMNKKAEDMGLKNTAFQNPNGLPAKEHYTTAFELALIMREAMKNEAFRNITGAKRYRIGEQTVVNHNKLLALYGSCIGGKTGYTMEAGRCLVSIAQQRGAPLICVTLGRRDDWNIHINAYEKWFSGLKSQVFAEKESMNISLAIAGGGSVRATNCDAIGANLFENSEKVQTVLRTTPFVYGNKDAGDVVGTAELWLYNVKIGESPLVLCNKIEVPVKKELFISGIIRFFRRIFLKKG